MAVALSRVLQSTGYGAKPQKIKRCHPEARPQTAWRPKDLVPTELFLGRRGAITKKSAVNQKQNYTA